ncbi:hypothetical protein IC229_14600 [Spirosoma sp. BT702]|uniref:Uncharacterized protein n=1 Tax=Spirosoma profusum TaxID=2771354 RepID=A0A927AU11_9BACT|nr:hypothetical protein [Spirosoma profusum]MBD2701877.1 hypothetical protein [Spirosoma profusum]
MNTNANQNTAQKATSLRLVLKTEEYLLSAITEVGFESRNINRWNEEGNLLKPPKANTWAKFTFLDYVWIKVLLFMSDLGVAKKSISKRAATQKDNVDKIIECLAKAPIDMNQEPMDEFGDIKKQVAYQALLAIVVDSFTIRSQYQLRIVKEGICQLWRDGEVIASSEMAELVDSDSFVQIAFSDIFVDFVASQILSGKHLIWRRLLNKPEATLVEHLKPVPDASTPNGVQAMNAVVVQLTIEDEDGQSESLPITQGVTKETARQLANYIVLGGYKKMTYIIDGTTSTFSNSDDAPD